MTSKKWRTPDDDVIKISGWEVSGRQRWQSQASEQEKLTKCTKRHFQGIVPRSVLTKTGGLASYISTLAVVRRSKARPTSTGNHQILQCHINVAHRQKAYERRTTIDGENMELNDEAMGSGPST